MAAIDTQKEAQPIALPGLARALMSVGKLDQKRGGGDLQKVTK